MQPATRRHFLKSSAAVGAFSFLPAYIARGAQSSKGVAPSDKLNVAFVGVAQRGGANLRRMAQTGLVNVVALCDVDPGQEGVQKAAADHPGAKPFKDFRRMFDSMGDGIDAVMISTPDHSHYAVAVAAMSLGKHVYVEKPLAHTFGQCDRLMELAESTGVVTQMGNQGHSEANFSQYKAWTEAGLIQDVTKITAWMNLRRRWHSWGGGTTEYPQSPIPAGMDFDAWTATAPEHPFSEKLHPGDWRSWFDYGSGCFGDWGPHILDTSHRFLKLGYPTSVTATHRDGVSPLVYPMESTIQFDFPEREGMPACEVTWYDGMKNKPSFPGDMTVIDPKSEERVPLNRSLRKPGKVIYAKDHTFKGESHGSTLQVVSPEEGLELPGYETEMSGHYLNFVRACKGEEEARSPFRVSGPLSQVFNLGMLAQRFGGELKFDAQSKRITNHPVADGLLDPAPRKGWEEFNRV